MPIHITAPFNKEQLKTLRTGDEVLITGSIISARDAAHKRIFESLKNGEELPVNMSGTVIYYMGPSPARPGRVTGSAGPTTSGRMDPYTPALLNAGVIAMIGKGRRSPEVKKAMKDNNAVYFAATGGAGALLSKAITKAECIAYPELGPEAIYALEVKDFPVFVAIDTKGKDIYEHNPNQRFGWKNAAARHSS